MACPHDVPQRDIGGGIGDEPGVRLSHAGQTVTASRDRATAKNDTLMKVLFQPAGCDFAGLFRCFRWPAMRLAVPVQRVSPMSIDAAAFKKGMRHLAASVTLITTRHRELRGGLTATAVCSVSAEPPQILVCVNKTASAHDPIGEAGFFCVNILSPEHRKIAERFAGMDDVEGDERFHDMGEWSMLSTGAPVLKGCPVSFDCRLVTKVAAGTHTIYIGEIVDLVLNAGATPLLYADGAFVHVDALKKAAQAA
jgi:flavin reductase (DIM6/NTAB) family NADH-FMN oxidoreductase RutF